MESLKRFSPENGYNTTRGNHIVATPASTGNGVRVVDISTKQGQQEILECARFPEKYMRKTQYTDCINLKYQSQTGREVSDLLIQTPPLTSKYPIRIQTSEKDGKQFCGSTIQKSTPHGDGFDDTYDPKTDCFDLTTNKDFYSYIEGEFTEALRKQVPESLFEKSELRIGNRLMIQSPAKEKDDGEEVVGIRVPFDTQTGELKLFVQKRNGFSSRDQSVPRFEELKGLTKIPPGILTFILSVHVYRQANKSRGIILTARQISIDRENSQQSLFTPLFVPRKIMDVEAGGCIVDCVEFVAYNSANANLSTQAADVEDELENQDDFPSFPPTTKKARIDGDVASSPPLQPQPQPMSHSKKQGEDDVDSTGHDGNGVDT